MPENNNKDPIENLFRKKAEEYDISYREEDWLKLEKQLDRQEQYRAAQTKRWLAAASLLFIFSLLGYAVYHNYQGINRLNEQLSDRESVETPANENGKDVLEDIPAAQQDSGGSQEGEDAGDRSESQSGTPENDAETQKDSPPSFAGREDPGGSEPEESNDGSEISGLEVSDETIPRVSAGEFACAACRISDFVVKENDLVTANTFRSAGTSMAALAAHENSARSPAKQPAMRPSASEPVSKSGIFIGFAAGPDLSTAGSLSDFDQPGYNIGLLFEYRLRSDISIRTGFMRASVHYVAGRSEYHPPSRLWSYDSMPDRTTAQCIILDIPISLKYDFWHFDRSRLYATAGFNTYIMLSEDYLFDYGYGSSSGEMQQWSGKTGTRHWMSNANISVGYAFDLSPQLSMQIEPFLKLPVREVGWGNVKLYSTGSLFTLNYKLY